MLKGMSSVDLLPHKNDGHTRRRIYQGQVFINPSRFWISVRLWCRCSWCNREENGNTDDGTRDDVCEEEEQELMDRGNILSDGEDDLPLQSSWKRKVARKLQGIKKAILKPSSRNLRSKVSGRNAAPDSVSKLFAPVGRVENSRHLRENR